MYKIQEIGNYKNICKFFWRFQKSMNILNEAYSVVNKHQTCFNSKSKIHKKHMHIFYGTCMITIPVVVVLIVKAAQLFFNI